MADNKYSFSKPMFLMSRIKRLETAIPRQAGGNFRSFGKVMAVKRETWEKVKKALAISE